MAASNVPRPLGVIGIAPAISDSGTIKKCSTSDGASIGNPRAMKKNDVYFVYLDGKLLPDLRAFLASQNERGAIEANGQKLTAVCRFTFPSEPIWREPLAATLEEGEE